MKALTIILGILAIPTIVSLLVLLGWLLKYLLKPKYIRIRNHLDLIGRHRHKTIIFKMPDGSKWEPYITSCGAMEFTCTNPNYGEVGRNRTMELKKKDFNDGQIKIYVVNNWDKIWSWRKASYSNY